jgi:predicted small secreted protein
MKYLTLPMIALVSVLALSGCNTIKGAGTDIHNAGTAMEDAAH